MEDKKFMTLEELTAVAQDKYLEIMKENRAKDILRAIGLFPDQTITNDVLILAQKPEATCVKRMKEWNFYKRVVKKAEKAIKVVSHHIENYNQDFTDENGNVYSQEMPKLICDVGFIFDISQTEGKEFDYLNSNKETIASHFEVVKKALESTAKEFDFEYVNQDEKSLIDYENKKVLVKDGLSVNDVIQELIEDVSEILLKTRQEEGLKNIDDFERNGVVYAVNSKLGLDLPEYDFSVANLTDEGLDQLKGNFQKIRSVTKQMLSNVENSIERAIRNLDKKMAEEQAKADEQQAETPKEQPKARKTRSKAKAKEAEAESEV